MNLVDFLQDNWFAISCLITLVGFVIKISSQMTKQHIESKQADTDLQHSLTEMKDELTKSHNELSKELKGEQQRLTDKLEEIEQKRIEGSKRTRIILDGVEATLVTLHDRGANGPVTASLKAIQDYKSQKAVED